MSVGSTKSYGKNARTVLFVLAGLLALGVVGSLWMGHRATSKAKDLAIEQATTIADRTLTLVFQPADLGHPADDVRALELSQQITSTVIDPSDFDNVTLYSPEGQILYSTQAGRIGNELAGEKDRIKEALKGPAQTSSADGIFTVLLPFHFPSGVGSVAAVELQRPDGPIASAAGPWRTNALFLFVLLGMLGMAVFGVSKLSAVAVQAPPQHEAPRPASSPASIMRPIQVPQPGLREEAEARRLAEERARSAEERLALLQDQYRRSLEELQRFQQAAKQEVHQVDAATEERALRAEAKLAALQQQVQIVNTERDRLAQALEEVRSAQTSPPADDTDHELLLREAERETIGLRAELEGALTQLAVAQRELQTITSRSGDDAAARADLDAAHGELMQAKNALETGRSKLAATERELEDARTELRALRTEEQRAAMLEDELRAARAELAGAVASHRAELVEREAGFEQKIRTTREEFQRQLEDIEGTYRGQLGQRETDLVGRITAAEAQAREAARELEAARAQLEAAERDADARERRLADAMAEVAAREAEVEAIKAEAATKVAGADEAVRRADETHEAVQSLRTDLARSEEALTVARGELEAERERATGVQGRTEALERERRALADRIEKQAAQLEDAVTANSELNRKLQELEARRQLELADDQGRAHIDELLRATQERLAGQTEKLMAAEDRVRELETELTGAAERLDVVEGELRTHQMSDALREIRGEHEDELADDDVLEDRRAAAPFTKELALDAKKSLARIMGITQLMKHKKDAKDQAQLIKQLTTFARRLDHTVADLADADRLARGTVELEIKRTDLEALIQRVVEESGIRGDHDVRIDAASLVIGIDPLRTEQILSGLLRTSGDRTGGGKEIVVRLVHADGGALLSVEDPEASSDASLSPVVKRFAEVQGGWAKVESRDGGGSAFRVFLPERRAAAEPTDGPELQILVDEPQGWNASAGQALSQELRRLAELPADD